MTPRELYEKHKGKRVRIVLNGKTFYGIIAGYCIGRPWPLIASITDSEGNTWKTLESGDYIITMKNNPLGYLYTEIDDIIFKFGH